MYYVVNAAGRTEGPYPPDWVRANATPSMLISHQQQWLRYDMHPDFRCSGCDVARQHGLRFCTTCGKAVEPAGPHTASQTRSPNLALINIILPGVAQIAFGQVAKGVVILILSLVSFPTVFVPLMIIVLAVIDGYKVGNKLRRTGFVGPWEFFPS